jgi:hypothetical protein
MIKLSKVSLVIFSLFFSVILVYGTAILGTLFKSQYLFTNGMLDRGYLFLFLALFIPILLYILLASHKNMQRIISVIIFSSVFLFILYTSVYFTLVREIVKGEFFNIDNTNKFMIIFWITTFIFVSTTHVATRAERK